MNLDDLIGLRVVVTGGRPKSGFTQKDAQELERAIWLLRPRQLAHGNAEGADIVSGAFVKKHGGVPFVFSVDTEIDGPWPRAGHKRNERMINTFNPDYVLAAPGGSGTAGCCAYAEKKGIRVVTVQEVLDGRD